MAKRKGLGRMKRHFDRQKVIREEQDEQGVLHPARYNAKGNWLFDRMPRPANPRTRRTALSLIFRNASAGTALPNDKACNTVREETTTEWISRRS